MVFSSSFFLLFFLPIIIIGYFIIPTKYAAAKNIFLLLVSLSFFSWETPKNIILLLASILLNFVTGLAIKVCSDIPKEKKLYFIAGILFNLGFLFYYKYFGFTVANINGIFGTSFTLPNIILPIGISFFTFQGMSYVIDVYRGEVEVCTNIAEFALYISLFPQLIAGPIVNYKDIAAQLHSHPSSSKQFSEGVERFLTGLFKKILIADVLAVPVTRISDLLATGIDMPSAWLSMICYTLQIYFDFSAYSDMAIGLAKMFGFSLLENFDHPYISSSVTEFWRRWHISLSTWFRDYLYIPLGGNRKGNVYFNLFIVFCATGLWHGAKWQFLLWGLWHGSFLIIERILIKYNILSKIPAMLRWVYTMLVVSLGWVLFNANGVHNALAMFKVLFGLNKFDFVELSFAYFFNTKIMITILIAIIGSTPLVSHFMNENRVNVGGVIVRRCVLFALFILCVASAVNGTYSPFIYFQF